MPDQPCMMYPIDLETSCDVRVVKSGYSTGLLRDLKQASEGDSNFIVTKTSPRGRRELMSHPEDVEAIKRGFKELQDLLKNPKAKKTLSALVENLKLEELCHRFVPIPTQELKALRDRNTPIDNVGDLFVAQLESSLIAEAEKMAGSFELKNRTAVKEQFKIDRLNGDIPYFTISNSTGEIFYNNLLIGQLAPMRIQIERIETLTIEADSLPQPLSD